ncbi:MAG: HlyD family efflux transporter periplasmic adaptor subunit [Aestuariivita sp.]|nr:HlyD family efflux transporter periplasmic adaptor subunit [Aestuariivita sp.]MCY4345670.1 HlyD family efflux transporter periplasmic adaptor subunit [Aestuariivita sp.]
MTQSIQHNFEIYRVLLENLSDGVLVVNFDGSVRIANSAFCRIFGLNKETVEKVLFGEIFATVEGLDEFTETVLDAVYNQHNVEKKIINLTIGEEQQSLALTTTYMTSDSDNDAERQAVIVAVSDITEITELHKSELRLAKVVESQLGELQTAYRDLETRNSEISTIRRSVRVARFSAFILVLGLFVGIAAWRIQPLDFFATVSGVASPGPFLNDTAEAGEPTLQTMVIEPRELNSTIALRGRLGLGQTEEITSPFDGHVSDIHVTPGQKVTEDDTLITFDTGQLATEFRRAEVQYIQARDKLSELENWASSDEMARARGSLRRARIALEESEQTFARSSFLLEQGIISAQEHEQAERSRTGRKLDFEAAEREFAATEDKSNEETLLVAKLEVDTAREQLESLEEKLEQSTATAPISGVFLEFESRDAKPLAKGRPVAQGELLATIADFERLSVVTTVDEVDVRKIEVGQRSTITGPGFPGLTIDGTVTRVSQRAVAGNRSAPQFEIVISLDKLDSNARDQLRVGMSAHLDIIVYRRPDAILVPIESVDRFGGQPQINILSQDTGTVETRPVVTGLTTLDSIEIVEGLTAGDVVVLP